VVKMTGSGRQRRFSEGTGMRKSNDDGDDHRQNHNNNKM